ncbi:unnamed protein product [Mytilus edulis]|uniref:Uncharacterized protein n=1 Tax=Mytilus edulis TaxID=6550 RepID=A0A8S3UHK5_MYTED|nr:unnamed protein product [Mytilus edulis]
MPNAYRCNGQTAYDFKAEKIPYLKHIKCPSVGISSDFSPTEARWFSIFLLQFAIDISGDQTTITNSGAEKTIFSTRDGVTAVSTDEWIKTTSMATVQAKSRNQGAMSTTHDNGYMTYDDGYVETRTITQHAQNENTKIPIAWIATTITTVTETTIRCFKSRHTYSAAEATSTGKVCNAEDLPKMDFVAPSISSRDSTHFVSEIVACYVELNLIVFTLISYQKVYLDRSV